MKKVAIWCAFLLFFLHGGVLVAAASEAEAEIEAEADAVRGAYADLVGAIPPEVAELLPVDFFAEDMTLVGNAVREATGAQAILAAVGRVTGLALQDNLSLLATDVKAVNRMQHNIALEHLVT